jgi:uncharacterized protein
MSDENRSPITSADRISSLDVIRGVALFGILLMNIVGFGLPMAYENPNNFGGAEGLNLFAWQVNALFFEGTMRGLFSVLFGASIVLMTSRAEARDSSIKVADIYFRRNLWLIVFGIVHAWLLLWTGDILYIYGIAGLFLFVFRKVSPRNLVILGVLVLASLVLKDTHEYVQISAMYEESRSAQTLLDKGDEISEEQQDAIDAWQEEVDGSKPTQEEIDELIAGKKGGYFTNIATNAERIVSQQSYLLYMYTFWDATGMMLIGMALLKLGILDAKRSSRFYLSMMAVGYGIGGAVNAYEINLLLNSNFGVLAAAQSYFTYDVGRLPVTLGHVGLVMLICRNGWLTWLTSRIAAVGRMALTSYVTHTVICAFIFFGIGFAMYGELQRYQLYYVVFGIWIFQLIVSPIWLQYYRFGPLEWLWRSLTYNRRQPMKRVM